MRATSTAIRLAIDVPVTNIPLAPSGKPNIWRDPFDDLPLDLDRNVIAPAEIGVQPGRQHFREHADRRAAAMHPAHEAGMNVAGRIGRDEIGELAIDVGELIRACAEAASRNCARTTSGIGCHTGRSRMVAM